jgi:hypothetical protein
MDRWYYFIFHILSWALIPKVNYLFLVFFIAHEVEFSETLNAIKDDLPLRAHIFLYGGVIRLHLLELNVLADILQGNFVHVHVGVAVRVAVPCWPHDLIEFRSRRETY